MYETTCKKCGVPIQAHDKRHEFCSKCWRKIQLKFCDVVDIMIEERLAELKAEALLTT